MGKHNDYIQILEYIPSEPTDLSTSGNGSVPWVDTGEQIGLVLLCTFKPNVKLTQRKVIMSPGKKKIPNTIEIVEFHLQHFAL